MSVVVITDPDAAARLQRFFLVAATRSNKDEMQAIAADARRLQLEEGIAVCLRLNPSHPMTEFARSLFRSYALTNSKI